MERWERLQAVLAGEEADRVPVTAWRHFPGRERKSEDLVAATLAHQAAFGWDLVKVQPTSVHFAEAWGAEYDYSAYRGTSPALVRPALAGPADLQRVEPVASDQGPFAEQLRVMWQLAQAWRGAVPFVQTVFSPLSVIEYMFAGPRTGRDASAVARCIAECPDDLHRATAAVASTLATYCRRVLEAGANGIFFAVTGLCRAGYLTQEEYAAFGRPYDLQVLEAVKGASLLILHNCGAGIYFDDVADYPVHILSWAASTEGNPPLAAAAERAPERTLMAGVAEKGVFLQGSPADVRRAAKAAVAATGGRRLIVAPECSYDPETPYENVRALRWALLEG